MWNSFIAFFGEEGELANRFPVPVLADLCASTGLSPQAAWAGLRLCSATALPALVDPAAGVIVLGSLYDRTTGLAARKLDPAITARGISVGSTLTERYWGDYVVIASWPAGAIHVVRGPSTGLPCYIVREDGLTVITSDCRLLAQYSLKPPAVEHERLRQLLLAPNMRTASTALSRVDEILPGKRMMVGSGGQAQDDAWSPWTFAACEAQFEDFDDAVVKLRTVIVECIGGQVREYTNPLLAVSGGLDSSIVAAALTLADTSFTGATLATRERNGDERQYARALGRHLDFPLREGFENPEWISLRVSAAAHLPRPCARAFSQSADTWLSSLAAEHGFDVYLHGGGGDCLFGYLRSARPVADAWMSAGPGQAWKTARDIATVTECSVVRAVRGGWSFARSGDPSYHWPVDRHFLHPDGAADLDVTNDWLDVPTGGLPGKAMHIAFILAILNRLEGYARERERPQLAVLMAQPVLETCLRIPTWMWCSGGINRALARRAFADVLPTEIMRRTTKGSPGSLAFDLFASQLSIIQEILLEGYLARSGLIDRPAVEAALSAPVVSETVCNRLMTLLDADVWATSWVSPVSQTAARP